MSVYICTHKKYDFPDIEGYIPVQAGAYGKNDDKTDYLKDDKGDNISEKNKYFCELTVLYYIWKNTSDDIVGLVHYRRYFMKSFWPFRKSFLSLTDSEIILREYDVILPGKWYFGDTLAEQYGRHHNISDLEKCREIIAYKYPDYITSFDSVMNQNNLYPFNMFIMKRSNFNLYMKWLFDILFELEKSVNENEYDSYNRRVYGFLSERLFNVWILKNHLKICVKEIMNVEEPEQYVLKHIVTRNIVRLFPKLQKQERKK